jgi:hypothetical protein
VGSGQRATVDEHGHLVIESYGVPA